jgi:hypothetical protein
MTANKALDGMLFHRACPWCDKHLAPWLVGRRPIKDGLPWYRINKTVPICPYCNNAVKRVPPKGLWSALGSVAFLIAYWFAAWFKVLPFSNALFYALLLLWFLGVLFVVSKASWERVNAV